LKFDTNRRQWFAETVVKRLAVASSSLDNCREFNALDFQTTMIAVFVGVGLYGGEQGAVHDVTVEVLLRNRVLVRTVRQMVSVGDKAPIRVDLEMPVLINSNERYTLQVTMKGPKTWWGDEGAAMYDFEGCGKTSFYESILLKIKTVQMYTMGRFPSLCS